MVSEQRAQRNQAKAGETAEELARKQQEREARAQKRKQQRTMRWASIGGNAQPPEPRAGSNVSLASTDGAGAVAARSTAADTIVQQSAAPKLEQSSQQQQQPRQPQQDELVAELAELDEQDEAELEDQLQEARDREISRAAALQAAAAGLDEAGDVDELIVRAQQPPQSDSNGLAIVVEKPSPAKAPDSPSLKPASPLAESKAVEQPAAHLLRQASSREASSAGTRDASTGDISRALRAYEDFCAAFLREHQYSAAADSPEGRLVEKLNAKVKRLARWLTRRVLRSQHVYKELFM